MSMDDDFLIINHDDHRVKEILKDLTTLEKMQNECDEYTYIEQDEIEDINKILSKIELDKLHEKINEKNNEEIDEEMMYIRPRRSLFPIYVVIGTTIASTIALLV